MQKEPDQDKLDLMRGKIIGLQSVAESVFKEALLAADPEEAVHRYFDLRGDVLKVGGVDYFLQQFRRIFLVGAGKASVRMASLGGGGAGATPVAILTPTQPPRTSSK